MKLSLSQRGPGSSVRITTGYRLDGPGIESRCWRDFPHLSRRALGPTQHPVQWVPSLSWPTALEGCEGSASRPGRSWPLGKTRYPFYRRLGGPQCWSGQMRKISPPPVFDPRTVQPVASRCTDWATFMYWKQTRNVTATPTTAPIYTKTSEPLHSG